VQRRSLRALAGCSQRNRHLFTSADPDVPALLAAAGGRRTAHRDPARQSPSRRAWEIRHGNRRHDAEELAFLACCPSRDRGRQAADDRPEAFGLYELVDHVVCASWPPVTRRATANSSTPRRRGWSCTSEIFDYSVSTGPRPRPRDYVQTIVPSFHSHHFHPANS
jgi:hypothetical protein